MIVSLAFFFFFFFSQAVAHIYIYIFADFFLILILWCLLFERTIKNAQNYFIVCLGNNVSTA